MAKNTLTLELVHAWTDADKKKYNAEYYQRHKEYWRNYYRDHVGTTYDTKTGKVITPTLQDMYKNANSKYRLKLANEALERAKGLTGKDYREAMDEYHRQLGNSFIEEDIENMGRAVNEGEIARKEAMAKASATRAPQAMIKNKPVQKESNKNSKTNKIVKSAKSAASTVGHKITNAGKEFVANWKLGMGIK